MGWGDLSKSWSKIAGRADNKEHSARRPGAPWSTKSENIIAGRDYGGHPVHLPHWGPGWKAEGCKGGWALGRKAQMSYHLQETILA